MARSASPPPSDSTEVQTRILRQARAQFFAHGYRRFTMDDLAAELGMSKKTLYQHFRSKDQIMAAVIGDFSGEVRGDAEAVLQNRSLSFAEKLRAFVESMVTRLSALHPHTIRDLQRYAPALHARIEEMRRKNIPYIFGRLIEEGQAAGFVRDNVSPSFAVEFFLHAMQGLLQPPALERLRLTPQEILPRAITLFFGGLLTPAGRKQHEKLFPR
jgi:AcrR family transcriptional regulator